MPDTERAWSATSVGGMGIRCHSIPGGFSPDGFYHATVPSYAEVVGCGTDTVQLTAMADRHVLISQSSFADHELATLSDLPFPVFVQVMSTLLEPGHPVEDDESCHTPTPIGF